VKAQQTPALDRPVPTDHLARRMNTPVLHVHFDFADPFSWFMTLELATALNGESHSVVWSGFEHRPPPTPMIGLDDPQIADAWNEARRIATAIGVDLRPPPLVPWTRKAHELALHAETAGTGDIVRSAIFEGYLLEGLDIGRVDVLVEIARTAGLDPTEAKAVLDVDRYDAMVAEARNSAQARGIERAPELEVGDRRLSGFHNAAVVRTFLGT